MIRIVSVLALLLWAAPTFAQTPFETLVMYRQEYPPRMTPAQVGELLNHVAWTHRAQGMKLLGKKAGANCPTPTGVLISCDYLVYSPDGATTHTGHDVLTGRTDGTTAVVAFTWGPGKEDLTEAIASGARQLVPPTLPDGDEPGPGEPTPQPTPTPTPGGIVWDLDSLRRQMRIEDKEDQLLLIINADVLARLARMEEKLDEVGTSMKEAFAWIGKFLTGPIGAAIVTWLVTRDDDPATP